MCTSSKLPLCLNSQGLRTSSTSNMQFGGTQVSVGGERSTPWTKATGHESEEYTAGGNSDECAHRKDIDPLRLDTRCRCLCRYPGYSVLYREWDCKTGGSSGLSRVSYSRHDQHSMTETKHLKSDMFRPSHVLSLRTCFSSAGP